MDYKLILQIAGVALGLLYLYLEYHANIWLWIVGILMPCVHCILYFKSGLYADFGMQLYYIAAGLWGLGAWLIAGKKKQGGSLEISRTPGLTWLIMVLIFVVLNTGLYYFLSLCTDSTVPFWDAFTTALSVIAMWMLSRKYIEQWLVWAVVDAVTVGLYFYKGIPLTACLYLLYTLIALAGFLKWKKELLSSQTELKLKKNQ